MSAQQPLKLAKIKEEIFKLGLTPDIVAEFFAKIMDKISPPPKTLPKHIKEGVAQSLKEHEQGLGVILETDEGVQNHFSNLKKQNV